MHCKGRWNSQECGTKSHLHSNHIHCYSNPPSLLTCSWNWKSGQSRQEGKLLQSTRAQKWRCPGPGFSRVRKRGRALWQAWHPPPFPGYHFRRLTGLPFFLLLPPSWVPLPPPPPFLAGCCLHHCCCSLILEQHGHLQLQPDWSKGADATHSEPEKGAPAARTLPPPQLEKRCPCHASRMRQLGKLKRGERCHGNGHVHPNALVALCTHTPHTHR